MSRLQSFGRALVPLSAALGATRRAQLEAQQPDGEGRAPLRLTNGSVSGNSSTGELESRVVVAREASKGIKPETLAEEDIQNLSSAVTAAASTTLSEHEIDSALETFSASRPDLFPSYLPHAASLVREILLDAHLVEATMARMQPPPPHGSSSSSSSSSSSLASSSSTLSISPSASFSASPSPPSTQLRRRRPSKAKQEGSAAGCWETLKTKTGNVCPLCLDLLASPIIADCSHSFCGSCLTRYFASVDVQQELEHGPRGRGRRPSSSSSSPASRVRAVPGGLAISGRAYHCPTCREVISYVTFERSLDGVLCGLVGSLPEDEEEELQDLVKEWRRRKDDYHDRVLDYKCRGVYSSRGAAGDEQGAEGDDDEDEDEDHLWADVFRRPEVYILPVVFAIVTLIMVCRGRKY